MKLVFKEAQLMIPGRGEILVRGEIDAGERVILRGPSGCGKTTLLRLASGLVAPRSGTVRFGDRLITGNPPHESRAGLVFQSGALFPHLSVEDNVAFGLRFQPLSRDWSADLRRARAREFLSKVGLENLATRSTPELSGGERQRVALVRTLICEPDYLLLDESLSAVDPARRAEVTDWVKGLCEARPVPTIVVTHSTDESARLGTRTVEWLDGDTCLNF